MLISEAMSCAHTHVHALGMPRRGLEVGPEMAKCYRGQGHMFYMWRKGKTAKNDSLIQD